MERFDVAIVGGGPAGSSAAAQAAANGAEAVVLEKGVPRNDREGLGPDSTDAAGILDYWVDIMDIDFEDIPDDVVLQVLDRAEFIGPTESLVIRETGIDATYPEFGFAVHRARFDDWLREEAEAAGAQYRVKASVKGVETDADGGAERHTLSLAGGEELAAEYLILADGPQRQVSIPTLDQFMPAGRSVSDYLSPPTANHIAYQEYRKIPDDVFEPTNIKFWWGWMPGETAYPWIFPNDDNVARVGLTMPIGMDIDAVEGREDYKLLEPDDERIPRGAEYLRRLLEIEYGDEYDVESDFPIVEDRGKSKGTETYPISSTRPIDSPTRAGIAVVGGAMGTTSAFHEGGDHVAMRTGKLAGELAATGKLGEYNDAWKAAIGEEVVRNAAMADVVRDYGPADWDRVFRAAKAMGAGEGATNIFDWSLEAGLTGLKLVGGYKRAKWGYRGGRIAQLREHEYAI